MTMDSLKGLEMVWKGSLQGEMVRKGRGSIAATSPTRVSRPKRLPFLDDPLPYKASHILYMGGSLVAGPFCQQSPRGSVGQSEGLQPWEPPMEGETQTLRRATMVANRN